MKSGTFNFWIDRKTRPEAFVNGARRRWATFPIEGETCVVCSDGPTLAATLRMGTPNPIQLFRIPFSPTLTRRHLVTIGWSKGRMKVLLDAKLLAEVPVEFPSDSKHAAAISLTTTPLVVLLLAGIAPSLARAHDGTPQTGGLLHGFAHPMGGLDHLCVMLAVGIWAAQRGGRATWLVPLTFLGVTAVGASLGMMGVSIPFVDQGIVASVLVLGVLIAAAAQLPLRAGAILVGLFAIFHGHSHGVHMAATASGLAYGAGFMLATAMLHALGISTTLLVRRQGQMPLLRYAGGALAGWGMYLCFA